jgi:hypothetical protein
MAFSLCQYCCVLREANVHFQDMTLIYCRLVFTCLKEPSLNIWQGNGVKDHKEFL